MDFDWDKANVEHIGLHNVSAEAEEAKWWFDNREELQKDFAQAFAEGRMRRRTEPRSAAQIPTATIRLDPVDVEMALYKLKRRASNIRPTSRCCCMKR